ncbi:MAG: AMIN-like domain-containing (lipo)protein [Acidimicrobiales bacterium]
MRTRTLTLTLIATVAAVTIGIAATPVGARAHAAPYCGIRWGSLVKAVPDYTIGSFTNVRAGRHSCYDRLVLDVAGPVTGYHVQYVSQVVQDGSGFTVPLRGGAYLEVIVHVPAYDAATGRSTYVPADLDELVNVSGFRTFRQVASAGSFEGQTAVGLGVRARLPFRVFVLAGPSTGSRVVVDVAHRWS